MRELPPLILHPFARQAGSERLVEQARAALMLHDAIESDGRTREELSAQVLEARFQEIRMLFYLGKDLFRWMAQCVESAGAREQSFADLLVNHAPESVRAKLRGWGVVDYAAIFSRSIGLKALFREPPEFAALEPAFVLHYHRYADALFDAFQDSERFAPLAPADYRFDLYGSGEYSRLLASQWGAP